MFEPVQGTKQTNMNRLWISIFLIVALAVVGTVLYTMSKRTAEGPAPATASVAAPAPGKADAVHDLKVVRATMGKDSTGTTAVWSVAIENRSADYTYGDIHYETSYIGADNRPLLVNQGTISMTIGPGAQKSAEVPDALYPAATAWYKFRITGATPKIQ